MGYVAYWQEQLNTQAAAHPKVDGTNPGGDNFVIFIKSRQNYIKCLHHGLSSTHIRKFHTHLSFIKFI